MNTAASAYLIGGLVAILAMQFGSAIGAALGTLAGAAYLQYAGRRRQ